MARSSTTDAGTSASNLAVRRNTDGCQNCKTNRIKCDRVKPICGCCVKKKESCNYSKIQFNTINKRTHDKRTGRKTKAKVAQEVLETQNTTSFKSPACKTASADRASLQSFQVIFEDPGRLGTQELQTSPLTTSTTSPMVADAEVPQRLSNIHQLLWPENTPFIMANTDYRRASQSSLSNSYSDDECQVSGSTTPSALEEEACAMEWSQITDVPTLDVSETLNTLSDQERTVSESEWPVTVSQPRPRDDLCELSSYASPDVMKILKFRNSRVLLHYYLNRAVATIHPQQRIVDNTSSNIILPYSLQHPVALEAILAFSASQMVMEDPRQQQALLYHKMSSIKHLNRLVFEQASALHEHGITPTYSLHMIVAVIAQITLSVTESGTETWQMHCGAAYNMMAALPKPDASDCSKELKAYIYCRLLKYLCFSEIARPTNRQLDLSLIDGSNLTVEFGVPSGGLKLAVMIARYAYRRESGIDPETQAVALTEIVSLLRKYLAQEVFEPLNSLSDHMIVKAVWRTTVWLYYNRCIMNTTAEHDNSRIALSRIVNYLRLLPIDSTFGTALAFVLLTMMPLIKEDDNGLRTWFLNLCRHLAQSTGTRNFLKIAEFSQICWNETDFGRCDTIAQVNRLAEATDHVILAA